MALVILYWQSIDNFIKNSKKIKNELKIKKQSLTLKII